MLSRTLKLGLLTGSALVFGSVARAQTAPVAGEGQSAGTVAAAAAVTPAPAAVDAGDATIRSVSQVRIVRLSLVHGVVEMDRNTGRGFEAAFANIPVVAGAKLRTGEGVAEVELEDNSSLRLAPNSEVRFVQLGRTAAGATETTVDVGKGLVFVALEKTKGNAFVLTEGSARIEMQPGAHLRLNADTPQVELAMFDGVAQLQVGSSLTTLGKKQTVVLTPTTQTVSSVTKGTQETDWDTWDKQESDYHKQKASFAGVGGGNGLYGSNDLSYYGSFVDMPDCGSMWRPYFASAAWDPFSSGTWAWYPSAGYSWVSPYPWGWLPFHSGTWASCGGAGWGWRPGGSWYGVNNVQAIRISKHPLPHPVPPPPVRSGSTLVPVNMKQMPVSGPGRGDEFTFRRDSAGLGVPRATFGNLHSFAGHVDQRGAVNRPLPMGVMTPMPSSAHQPGGMTNASRGSFGPAGARAGAASPSASRSMSAGQSSSGVSMSAPSSGGMHSSSAPSSAGAHK